MSHDSSARLQRRHQLLHRAARLRRDVDPRRPLHLHQLAIDLPLQQVAAVLVDQIPLVERQHQRPARLDHHRQHPLVLLGQRLRRVDQHDRPPPRRRSRRVCAPTHRTRARWPGRPCDAARRCRRNARSCRPFRSASRPDPRSCPRRRGPPSALRRPAGSTTSSCRHSACPPTRRGADLPRPTPSRTPSGSASITLSSRSATPRPCIALTGCGSPSPSDHNSAASASPRSESTLLAARNTGLPDRCSSFAAASSAAVAPTTASTTKMIASAVRIATDACSATNCCSPLASGSQPPVSCTTNRRPDHSSRRRTPDRGSHPERPAPPPRGGPESGSPASTYRRSAARPRPPPVAARRLPRSPPRRLLPRVPSRSRRPTCRPSSSMPRRAAGRAPSGARSPRTRSCHWCRPPPRRRRRATATPRGWNPDGPAASRPPAPSRSRRRGRTRRSGRYAAAPALRPTR